MRRCHAPRHRQGGGGIGRPCTAPFRVQGRSSRGLRLLCAGPDHAHQGAGRHRRSDQQCRLHVCGPPDGAADPTGTSRARWWTARQRPRRCSTQWCRWVKRGLRGTTRLRSLTRGAMRPSWWRWKTGLLVMHDQLSRALDADIFSPAGHLRMSRAKIDFYSQPLVSPDLAAQARATIDALQARHWPPPGETTERTGRCQPMSFERTSCRRTTVPSTRCGISIWRWLRARSSATWARTGRARRPRSGCCSAWPGRPSGRAEIFGLDCQRQAVEAHRRLAYVAGEANLWPSLTGMDTLHLLGRVQGQVDAAYRDELIARFDLDPGKKVRAYSKGNRQKLLLIAALMTARRSARARRADQWTGSADGAGVPAQHPARRASAARRCSCPRTS